jgi:LacI family transcriptional regulator
MSESYLDSFRLLAKIPCDGILARVSSDEMAKVARALPVPLVNISSLVRNPRVNTVRRDDRGIGHLCARHLVGKGFSRIGVVVMPPAAGWCFGETTAGFLEHIREHGDGAEIFTHRLDLKLSEPVMLRRFRSWIKTLRLPCALFVTDDRFAIAAMDVCKQEGLRIPQDIAVISSVQTPEVQHACSPTLTHPVQDAHWLIRPACERLAELMRNPRQPVRIEVIPCPGIVKGESTDTIAVDDPMVARALDYIVARFHEGIDVSHIVAELGCSRRALERRFSKLMKVTLHTHLAEVRVKSAKKRIEAATTEKLDEIARSCGFLDSKTFRQTFLRVTGVTPGKWRKDRGAARTGRG